MSFFGLLFILFIFFILWPVVKLVISMNRARKRMNNFFRQAQGYSSQSAYGDYGASFDGQHTNKGGWTRTQPPAKKKINKDVGEYVEWEDIECCNTHMDKNSPKSGTSFRREEQVVDAEWEDIR